MYNAALPFLWVALICGILAAIQTLVVSSNPLQIGADEGFDLAKATLVASGHVLYSEVWNDQAPLHTKFVSLLASRTSLNPFLPRFVTFLFAELLLCAFFFLVNVRSNSPAAPAETFPGDKSYILIGGGKFARVRSYSMNYFMGSYYYPDDMTGGAIRYKRMEAIDSPAERWVFIDEHEDSIRGAEFQFLGIQWLRYDWTDIPAAHHLT